MTVRHGRVAELTAARSFTIRDVPFPPPPPGRLLVRVTHVGVCASDLHDWQAGPGPGQPPPRLGHEPVGVVCEAGAGVHHPRPGQVVTGRLVPAFADYVYADPADAVPVPDGVDPAVAVGEPLGCVVDGYRRAQPAPGARTAVVGLGFMGLVMTRLLALSPVTTVLAVDPRSDARDAAAGLGATGQHQPDDPTLRPDTADLVVEASGTQAGLDLATRLAAEHGVVSILGYHRAPSRAVDLRTWNWKALTVINAHVRDPHRLAEATQAALRLLAAGRLPLDRLLTHHYTLEDLDTAYQALEQKPAGFIKAVVTL